MGFVPNLPQKMLEDETFVEDMARFADGVLTQAQVRKKWHVFDEAEWIALGQSDELVEKIEVTRTRRVRSGQTKKELSQLHIIKAPAILDGLMMDSKQSGKTRIDAVRALDQLATPEASRLAQEMDHIHIVIDLGADVRARGEVTGPGDVLVFDAPIRPDNHTIDTTPVRSIPNNIVDEPVRRRGRPPGSRNRKTIAAEQQLPFTDGGDGDEKSL